MRIQMKKIICSTDFSDLSNHAVNYGIALAKEFGIKLYLCHVIDLSSATMYGEATFAFEAQNRHMEEYAHAQLKQLIGENDIDWEPLVTAGRAADEIARMSEENDADMVITATRGRSGLKRLVLGSVTEQLMRILPCPLLTVKSPGQEPSASVEQEVSFKRILIGCDFSPDSALAYEYGLSLAQEFQSELHLAHVIAPPIYKDMPKPHIEARDKLRHDLREQLNERLNKLIPEEAFNWCTPKTTLLAGNPHEELAKYALLHGIDLIVLGVRGHGSVERLFVGSTTDRVVRKALCHVLSVRRISHED